MKKLTALLLCCLVLAGCAQPNHTYTPSETQTSTMAPTQTSPVQTEAPTVPETTAPEPQATQPETEPAPTVDGKPRLTVYTMDANLENFLETTVEVEEVTETVILEQLIEAGVLPAGVEVNSITHESNALQIDFNSAFGDLILAQGSAGERAVMGCVVNTFLTAYSADSVYITVDGSVLESGHVVYDMALEFYY